MIRAAAVAAALCLAACSRGRTDRTIIQNKGSDTMVNIAQAWAAEYQKTRPTTGVAVSGGGSGTGIAALSNGTVDIANSSRDIKKAEKEQAKKNTGKETIEFVVAYDALAVYAHKANPITKITKASLGCIFGEKGTCTKWTDLGLEVPGCSGQEIVRVGRQNNSGTYVFFREWVLGKEGDFKLGSRDMQGSKDVVDLVEHTPCAIGYSGIGYRTEGVKAVCLAATEEEQCVDPSIEAAVAGIYPMARALYMITLGEPQGEIARYLEWVRSPAGQAFVEQAGYAPLAKDKQRPVPQ
jgi:phosphate transport system substrate-binding protein